MWVLGLSWTRFALLGFDGVEADSNAMLLFLPTVLALLVPIGLIIFTRRDRKNPNERAVSRRLPRKSCLTRLFLRVFRG